ncbi:MAG: VCBS repeat-containing protein, partial [Acidobacteriota bacterium]|nr:VCBS repeat-containing protein [Acidobacteriota bacterium]
MTIRAGARALCLFLGLALPAARSAAQCTGCPQASFSAPRSFFVPGDNRVVVSADFNGDGRPDVATLTGSYPNSVRILLGSADSVLTSPATYQVAADSFFGYGMKVGDFDGDGKPDLLITSGGTGLYLMRGVGDGSFPTAEKSPTVKANFQLAVGDFNGDGNLDAATLDDSYNASNVSIYYGDGSGHFALPITIPVGPSASELQAADLNGDGADELIAINGASNSISLITGVAMGPVAPARILTVGTNPQGLAIGDWNRDGLLDLAVTNSEHVLTVLLGSGTLAFQPPVYSSPANFGGRLLTGDFDGDGKQDLVAIQDWLKFAAGDGTGRFGDPVIVGPVSTAMVVSDVDRDGRSDIVAANFSYVAVLSHLTAGPPLFAGVAGFRLGFGDFNGDGKLDVVAFAPDVTILMSSPGGFTRTAPFSIFQSSSGFGVVGDVNSDGRPDLLLISGNQLAVLRGTGGAGFLAPSYFDLGNDTRWISVGDLNQDGKLDVIGASYSGNSISVLLGRGDGSFQPRTEFAVGSRPNSIALADFNRDGKPDVAVANDGGTIALLLGNGSGGFSSIASFSAESPRALIPFDFDQDGKFGVAFLGSFSSGVLTIMKGDGAGQLAAPTTIGTDTSASTLTAVDFDKDGRPDLAVGTFTGSLNLFRNLGGGAFAESTRYFLGAQMLALAAGDLDGDGLVDLVTGTGGFGPIGVEILRNSNCLPRTLSVATDISGCQVPGSSLSPQPVLHLLDEGSNLVTCDPGPVTASLVPMTGTAGAVLAGTKSVSSIGGVATFTDLSVNLPGAGYRLGFEHPQGARAQTRSFSQGLQVSISGPFVVCGST